MSNEDAQYLMERIESMICLLQARADPGAAEALLELNRFRSRLESILAGECIGGDDLEKAFCLLLESRPTLGLAFVAGMESDLASYCLDKTNALVKVEKARALTLEELEEKRRWKARLRLFTREQVE